MVFTSVFTDCAVACGVCNISGNAAPTSLWLSLSGEQQRFAADSFGPPISADETLKLVISFYLVCVCVYVSAPARVCARQIL